MFSTRSSIKYNTPDYKYFAFPLYLESGQDDSNSSVGERSPETIEINANNDTESNNNFVESILDNRYVLKHYI